MRHTLPLTPQFYVTAPQPCPYLEGRMERKLFTALQGGNATDLNDSLSAQGFRRSQNVLYRPSCADCASCLSARIDVAAFKAKDGHFDAPLYCLQFHPEVTEAMNRKWLRKASHMLSEPGAQSAKDQLADRIRHDAEMNAWAWRFLSHWTSLDTQAP